MRRLARDQWVRLHGTPRVTVLVGAHAREVYLAWLALGETTATLIDGDGDDLDRCIREACAQASIRPSDTIAVCTTRRELVAWRTGRTDRLAAMIDEGVVELSEPAVAEPRVHSLPLDARSAAEAAMFEALEATPATAGRFQLNAYLSVRFGSVACEVDLLSREDRLAIEIDGVHHFADPSCYRRDRRKDLLLQTQGLIVLRVLAEDVLADPRDAVAAVCQVLAHRRGAR